MGRAVLSFLMVAMMERESIDWSQSVAIVIGVETFLSANAPRDVLYGGDDAVDFTWMLTKELPSLLPADRVLLLLSGRPDKAVSQAHLLVLQREGSVIVEEFDAARVYALIAEYGRKVGPDGVLILFIATHGITDRGAHILLMPQSNKTEPAGVELNGMLQAIPAGHGRRVLLFVDACRAPFATPSRLFEDLRFPGQYAIFSASGPGGSAWPDQQLGNGYFTRAILDGLRCRASAPAGFITPSSLGAFISSRVREASSNRQRPEARFGGLTDLPLFSCRPPREIARIVRPLPDAHVTAADSVDVEVFPSSLHVTALVCANTTGECWKQNPEPVPATAGAITSIVVKYADADAFRVYAAFSADDHFLRGEEHFPSVPLEHRAENIVYWLGPVNVALEAEKLPAITEPREGQNIASFRIDAEGRIPKGTHAFFAVEPATMAPQLFIQPRIHSTRDDGSVTGSIYLGNETQGINESFRIYLLACTSENPFRGEKIVVSVPPACQVSGAVKVFRVQ